MLLHVVTGCAPEVLDTTSETAYQASLADMRDGLGFWPDTHLVAAVQHLEIASYLWPDAVMRCGGAKIDPATGRPDVDAVMHGLDRLELVRLADRVRACRDEDSRLA